MMARTEKDFLNTFETYIKVTKDRLKDGRIIDAYDELSIMQTMVAQRIAEVEGKAVWVTMDPRVTDLGEIAEECKKIFIDTNKSAFIQQAQRVSEAEFERCANEIANEVIEEEPQYDRYYDGKSIEPEEDFGAEMLKKLTE